MKPTLILICGYKGSGKDTLYHSFVGDNQYNWLVYKRNSELPNLSSLITNKIKRYAFADELKKEVGNIDGPKETMRSAWIKYANEKRSSDINYFCRKVYLKLIEETDEVDLFVITDLRFYNELDYLKARYDDVYTIRVVREEVPVPDTSIESEHQLDNLETDFIATDKETNFDNYEYTETI